MAANKTNLQDNDLAAFFTGFDLLRETFTKFVDSPELPKRIFIVHGIGGSGKSSLLRMFRLHCKSIGVPVALVSGDDSRSVDAVLSRWSDGLQADKVGLPKFEKTLDHYIQILARVDEQTRKGSKLAGATVGAALGSIFPIVGPLANESVEALMNWLRKFLSKPDLDLWQDPTKRLTEDFLSDIAAVAKKRRLVLILDTFEKMPQLEQWVCGLALDLHPNVLLVIAGRALPDWETEWAGWMTHAYSDELRTMTDDVMRELIVRYYRHLRGMEPDPTQVTKIIHSAHGLPLAATSVVQLWVRHAFSDSADVWPHVAMNLVERLCKGVSKELLPILNAASTVRYFNQSVLKAVTNQEVVDDVYKELTDFPFILPRGSKVFMIHDVVRELLEDNLRVQNPKNYLEFHQRAAAYFAQRLASEPGAGAELPSLEFIYHRIQMDEKQGIALYFQPFAEHLTRYGRHSQLRGLVNDVTTYRSRLEHASSLWLEYYRARLAQLEIRNDHAETMFETIIGDMEAEPKLKAYALCDLGEILVRDQRLTHAGVSERALQILERARNTTDIDAKLVFVFTHLSRVHNLRGEWHQTIEALQQQLLFFREIPDQVGIALTLAELRWTYGRWGHWKDAFAAETEAHEVCKKIPDNSYLRARLVKFSWISLWAGRYRSAEVQIREGLDYATRADDAPRKVDLQMVLGYALGLQNKFEEALLNFEQAVKTIRDKERYYDFDLSVAEGFFGHTLVKQGKLDQAEEHLQAALLGKRKIKDEGGIPEILNWLGELSEIRRDWQQAESHYVESLKLRTIGRHHFECGAITGLVRAMYAQNRHDEIMPLLDEAEALAQQFEYNDHLASLSLTRAHLAWGRPDALRHLQHALIYGLRFNRFLLYEVLSGRPQGTPLIPLISYLGGRGNEGRQMLITLGEWWSTGVNDTGTPRPDTISSIGETVSLTEAERDARRCEPGDGSLPEMVIEQINQVINNAKQSTTEGQGE